MKKVIQEILDDCYQDILITKEEIFDLSNKLTFLIEHSSTIEIRIARIKLDTMVNHCYYMEKIYYGIQDVLNKY